MPPRRSYMVGGQCYRGHALEGENLRYRPSRVPGDPPYVLCKLCQCENDAAPRKREKERERREAAKRARAALW